MSVKYRNKILTQWQLILSRGGMLSPPFSSVFTTFDPCSQPKMVIMGYHRVGISRARERQARVDR